jgi:hypothetical protein
MSHLMAFCCAQHMAFHLNGSGRGIHIEYAQLTKEHMRVALLAPSSLPHRGGSILCPNLWVSTVLTELGGWQARTVIVERNSNIYCHIHDA